MQPLVQRAPAFFAPGAPDPTVRPAATDAYAALLAAAGYDLTRRDAPAGHNLTQADLDGAVAWLASNFPAA